MRLVRDVKRLKRLIAALAVAGMLVAFTSPASATPLSYARYHCLKLVQAQAGGLWPAYWHQVNLLAGPQMMGGSQLVHGVRVAAIALLQNNNTANRQTLGGSCMSLPGMNPGGQ
ncbi:MAG: hypothetical protein ACXWEG_01865 [Actinomycetota bacterium]